jgi:hypothetical protein
MNEIFCLSMKFFLGDATKGSVEGYKNLNFFTILEKGIFFISNLSNVLCHYLKKQPCYVFSNISKIIPFILMVGNK